MAKITLEDIIGLEPNKVPTDAKSYSTFIYANPKTGKSTFVNDLYGEKVLFLATERRHDAISGAMVINIDSWAEFLQAMKLLKKPEVQEKFDAICIDTVTRLESYCEKYVLQNLNVDDLSDVAWGGGFSAYNKEIENGLSLIEKSGYTPVFISHAKTETVKVLKSEASKEQESVKGAKLIKEKDGKEYVEYQKQIPDIKTKFFNMINRIADHVLYLGITVDSNGSETRRIFYRDTPEHFAGASFAHIQDYSELSPEAYQEAVEKALSKEGKSHVEDRKREQSKGPQYNFDELMLELNKIGKELQDNGKGKERNAVVEKVLGHGKKAKDLDKSQVEVLSVLVNELKEL